MLAGDGGARFSTSGACADACGAHAGTAVDTHPGDARTTLHGPFPPACAGCDGGCRARSGSAPAWPSLAACLCCWTRQPSASCPQLLCQRCEPSGPGLLLPRRLDMLIECPSTLQPYPQTQASRQQHVSLPPPLCPPHTYTHTSLLPASMCRCCPTCSGCRLPRPMHTGCGAWRQRLPTLRRCRPPQSMATPQQQTTGSCGSAAARRGS